MEKLEFNNLLLKTAFSCMACDGDIDEKEVQLIRRLHEDDKTFGEVDINSELNSLLQSINRDGRVFLKNYISELTTAELSEADELRLIEVAIATIEADDKIEYSEIKFFKVIRSKLRIANDVILEKHPKFEEYLEQDIMSESYLSGLQENVFDTVLPKFELITKIDEDILKNIKDTSEE